MNPSDDESRRRRGVALIASASTSFIDILGKMVVGCGFDVETPVLAEPSWLSMTRTQPTVVICDCTESEPTIQRLIVETLARGLPLLVVAARREQAQARKGPLPHRVAWLEFPVAREPFRATLDDLVKPRTVRQRNLVVTAAGVTIEAGITAKPLLESVSSSALLLRDGAAIRRPIRVQDDARPVVCASHDWVKE